MATFEFHLSHLNHLIGQNFAFSYATMILSDFPASIHSTKVLIEGVPDLIPEGSDVLHGCPCHIEMAPAFR